MRMGLGLGRSHKAGVSDSRTFTGTSEEMSGKSLQLMTKCTSAYLNSTQRVLETKLVVEERYALSPSSANHLSFVSSGRNDVLLLP